jgi:hypothetical protein
MALWPMNVARSLAVSGTRSRAAVVGVVGVVGCTALPSGMKGNLAGKPLKPM